MNENMTVAALKACGHTLVQVLVQGTQRVVPVLRVAGKDIVIAGWDIVETTTAESLAVRVVKADVDVSPFAMLPAATLLVANEAPATHTTSGNKRWLWLQKNYPTAATSFEKSHFVNCEYMVRAWATLDVELNDDDSNDDDRDREAAAFDWYHNNDTLLNFGAIASYLRRDDLRTSSQVHDEKRHNDYLQVQLRKEWRRLPGKLRRL